MAERETRPEEERATTEEAEGLPLVVEIYAGVGEQPVSEVFRPGEYNPDMNVRDLVDRVLFGGRTELEEELPLKRIREELDKGGQILDKERGRAQGAIDNYMREEETNTGRKYNYLQFRVTRPQRGGEPLFPLAIHEYTLTKLDAYFGLVLTEY